MEPSEEEEKVEVFFYIIFPEDINSGFKKNIINEK